MPGEVAVALFWMEARWGVPSQLTWIARLLHHICYGVRLGPLDVTWCVFRSDVQVGWNWVKWKCWHSGGGGDDTLPNARNSLASCPRHSYLLLTLFNDVIDDFVSTRGDTRLCDPCFFGWNQRHWSVPPWSGCPGCPGTSTLVTGNHDWLWNEQRYLIKQTLPFSEKLAVSVVGIPFGQFNVESRTIRSHASSGGSIKRGSRTTPTIHFAFVTISLVSSHSSLHHNRFLSLSSISLSLFSKLLSMFSKYTTND